MQLSHTIGDAYTVMLQQLTSDDVATKPQWLNPHCTPRPAPTEVNQRRGVSQQLRPATTQDQPARQGASGTLYLVLVIVIQSQWLIDHSSFIIQSWPLKKMQTGQAQLVRR